MGEYTTVSPKGAKVATVAFTDAKTYEMAAALRAVIQGEFKGSPSVESHQIDSVLNSMELGQPLDSAEWDALQRLARKYAAQVAALKASPDWEGQNPVVPPRAAGRVVEALPVLRPSLLAMLREADAPQQDSNTGAMVALYPDPATARKLAQPGGEAAADIHLTLAFLGPAGMLRDEEGLREAVGRWASRTAPLRGTVSGVGHFTGGPEPVTYASADVPDLPEARQVLVDALQSAGAPPSAEHGFTPHMTLAYGDVQPELGNLPLDFDHVALVLGERRTDFPLSGRQGRPAALRQAASPLDPLAHVRPSTAARLREGSPQPPPNLRPAQGVQEALAAGKPPAECGTCLMFDEGYCWGYGAGYGSSFPTQEDWVCDSYETDPDWQAQDAEADEAEGA